MVRDPVGVPDDSAAAAPAEGADRGSLQAGSGPARGASGAGPPGGADLALTLRADPSEVRATLAATVGWMARHGVGCQDAGRLELVLAEVLNNVVEHALAGQPEAGIAVLLRLGAGGLHCEVTDGGAALPGDALPEGRLPGTGMPQADLPEGGYGWFLIRSLTEDLRYRREGGINRLSFRVGDRPG